MSGLRCEVKDQYFGGLAIGDGDFALVFEHQGVAGFKAMPIDDQYAER